MPFGNPIVAGTSLVRAAVKSPNYQPGVSGWTINRDGTAEFDSATIRGTLTGATITGGVITGATITGGEMTLGPGDVDTGPAIVLDGSTGIITVVGPTGKKIVIDPRVTNPQIFFYSLNQNVFAFINQPATDPNHATLGMNAGQYLAPDTIARTQRVWLRSDVDIATMEIIRPSDQSKFGGAVVLTSTSARIGYSNDNGLVHRTIEFDAGAVKLNPNGSVVSNHLVRNAGVSLLPNVRGVSELAVTAGTNTTISATFVNMAGTGSVTSFTYPKAFSDSRTKLSMAVTFFSTVSDTSVEFALRVNNVDYVLHGLFSTIGTDRICFTGWTYVPGSPTLTNGNWTVQARWRRSSGTGTLTRATQDMLAIEAAELAP